MPLKITHDLDVFGHNLEGRTITLEYKKFYLVCTYFPHSCQKLRRLDYRVDEWDTDFKNFIKALEQNGKPVIICGDLNVAHKPIDIYDPFRNTNTAGFSSRERNSFSELLDVSINY